VRKIHQDARLRKAKRFRRFPSVPEQRAVEIGADELHTRLEWELRGRPRALHNLRRSYRALCLNLYRRLQAIGRSHRMLSRSAA
jgi:hypothetical protein